MKDIIEREINNIQEFIRYLEDEKISISYIFCNKKFYKFENCLLKIGAYGTTTLFNEEKKDIIIKLEIENKDEKEANKKLKKIKKIFKEKFNLFQLSNEDYYIFINKNYLKITLEENLHSLNLEFKNSNFSFSIFIKNLGIVNSLKELPEFPDEIRLLIEMQD